MKRAVINNQEVVNTEEISVKAQWRFRSHSKPTGITFQEGAKYENRDLQDVTLARTWFVRSSE